MPADIQPEAGPGEGPSGLEASDCRDPFGNQGTSGAQPTEASTNPRLHQAGASVRLGPSPGPASGGRSGSRIRP